MEKPVYLLASIAFLAVFLIFIMTRMIEPSAEMLNMISIAPQFQMMLFNAKGVVSTGGVGIDEKDYRTVETFKDIAEECEKGPIPCLFAHSELLSPAMIETVKHIKVDRRVQLLMTQLKGEVRMWGGLEGLKGESCVGECADKFYAAFGSPVAVEYTPFSIAGTLYKNRDIVKDLFCDGDLSNCPAHKTCMECYKVYLEKGKDSITDLIRMNCHEACFLVAKSVEYASLGERYTPV